MTKTMTIAAIVLASTTTIAAASTCKNTIETIDGVVTYTGSVCTGQDPASDVVLGAMTDARNAPDVMANSIPVTDAERISRLSNRIDNLTTRIRAMDRGPKKRELRQKRRVLRDRLSNLTG